MSYLDVTKMKNKLECELNNIDHKMQASCFRKVWTSVTELVLKWFMTSKLDYWKRSIKTPNCLTYFLVITEKQIHLSYIALYYTSDTTQSNQRYQLTKENSTVHEFR